MRSEAIFRAKLMIENKYSLCQTVSKATRVSAYFAAEHGGDDQ